MVEYTRVRIPVLRQPRTRENVIISVSALGEVNRTNQGTSSSAAVEAGPPRFKAWHKQRTSLRLLAGQDLPGLLEFREGGTLTMAYHRADSILPVEHFKTAVRKIKRNEGGKFKSQYLVDLEILKSYD